MADREGVDMSKRISNRLAEAGRRADSGTSARQDPAAQRMMERLGSDHRLLPEVLREVLHLRRFGVEVTPEIMDRVVDTVEERDAARHRVVPVASPSPRGPQAKRRPTGRFHDVTATGPVVYYVRIGNRVKIGTSTNLRDRLETINPEELLAVEQGGPAKERLRHEQFGALRTHGEWFRYEGSLVRHIESIRQGQP